MDIVLEKMFDTLISYSTNSLRQIMARKIGSSILIDENSIDKKILIWREKFKISYLITQLEFFMV
jgi:hypothetical protein